AQEGAHRCERAGDRRRREPPRPSAPELRDVVREHAHVDLPKVTLTEPAHELLQVDAVCAPRSVAQCRGGEEALDGRTGVHPGRVRAPAPASSRGAPPRYSSATRGSSSSAAPGPTRRTTPMSI